MFILFLSAFFGCNRDDVSVQQIYPNLVLSTTQLDFGEVLVGETLTSQIEVINAGEGSLYLSDFRWSADTSDAFRIVNSEQESQKIDQGEIVNLQFDFTPLDYGSYEGIFLFDSNDEELKNLELQMIGEGGDGPQPDIFVDNALLIFPDTGAGESTTLFFTLTNNGDTDLVISSTSQLGSGAFSLVGDLDNVTLAAGVQSSILVEYRPIHEVGDEGVLTINSNDPDTPSLEVSFIGNGGGDFEYPVADIVCPSFVTAPTILDLNGASSTSPNGTDLTYFWSFLQKPTGSVATIRNDSGPIEATSTEQGDSIYLDVDVAGTYQVNLVVEDETGTKSSPSECIFYAEPPSDIHVELSWNDENADLDLHFVRTEDGLFSFENDCCWCNENPSWELVSDNNPILSQDSDDASLPEITDLSIAVDGNYYARVHYFSDRGAGQVNATLKLYVSGVLEGQYTTSLVHNQVWNVAYVRWPQAYVIEELEVVDYDGPRSCY